MNLSVLFRLTLCLVMLHGWVDVSPEEIGGGFSKNDSGEVQPLPDLTGQSPGVAGAGIVASRKDGDVEGDGTATVPVVERVHEAVNQSGEESVTVSECVGTRFKKCR